MERRDRFLPPYISTRFTARLLTILLLTTADISGLSAGFEISQLHVLSGIGDYADVDEETRWAYTFIRNTLLVSRLVLYASIAIAFIAWLHRCRINARAFGCRRFRYSRIWSIISRIVIASGTMSLSVASCPSMSRCTVAGTISSICAR